METEKRVSPKPNRIKAWPVLVGLAIVIIVMYFIVDHHHRQSNATITQSQQTMTVDDLRWAYVSLPLPSGMAMQPLFPDKKQDRQTLQNLLQWIQKAQLLKDDNMSIPMRSETLTLMGKDGKGISVQYGSACQTIKSSNGNNGVECQSVKDVVTIIRDGDTKPTFYQSKELHEFLEKAPKTIPFVPYTVYPKSVKTGSTFQVEGNAWLTTKVTVNLLQGREVVASKTAVPDHGHFQIDFTCPSIKPGGYLMEYMADKGPEMNSPINVTP